MAQRLCTAFWEELSAVNFYRALGGWKFAGFSSQTFDSLFREMSETIPNSLAKILMRYHWKMKYLEAIKVSTSSIQGFSQQDWENARDLRDRLLARLKHYKSRSLRDVFNNPKETCNHTLLAADNDAALIEEKGK